MAFDQTPDVEINFFILQKVKPLLMTRKFHDLLNIIKYITIFDFEVPEVNSSEWKTLQAATKLREKWKAEGSHYWSKNRENTLIKRSKRAADLPATDYTIQLYFVVDWYLYQT